MVEAFEKVKRLSRSVQYDLCGFCGQSRVPSPSGGWIYPAALPDGRRILLLKTLMTNACQNDCLYCVNRAGRDFPRFSFRPEELARLFMLLYDRGAVRGLFLSSAVFDQPDATMEQMIETVEILRFKYRFTGYVHLKVLPRTSFDLVERAVSLAQRVSVNLEAPNPERLKLIAPAKDFKQDLLLLMNWIHSLISEQNGRRVTQTTQLVVGAAGESDLEILRTTDWLYRKLGLSRVYFSAFHPVPDTPLEGHPPSPPLREHRLYQSDFLLREYGFSFDELPFALSGNLPLRPDPKLAWALQHPEFFPLEVNRASRWELLRVPGIGPKSASRIIKFRANDKFRTLKQLKGVGTVVKRAAPFILIDGKPGTRFLDLPAKRNLIPLELLLEDHHQLESSQLQLITAEVGR